MAPAKYTVAVLFGLVLMLAPWKFAHAQAPLDEATKLNNRAVTLYQTGKAGEAIPLAKRALAIREKALPAGRLEIGQRLSNTAFLTHEATEWRRSSPGGMALAFQRTGAASGDMVS